MRVFALTTGRAGSVTFSKACGHMTNFTAGHETRFYKVGDDRVTYPDNHVEADCRLSFFLGRLALAHPEAYYVRMVRDVKSVAHSFTKCYMRQASVESVVGAWGLAIAPQTRGDFYTAALDYAHATDCNIREFLKDKPHMEFWIEDNPQEAFSEFWERIGAQGDLRGALGEFKIKHNAGPEAE